MGIKSGEKNTKQVYNTIYIVNVSGDIELALGRSRFYDPAKTEGSA